MSTYDCVSDPWSLFTGRSPQEFDADAARNAIEGKRILITGAGGYIGSALARRLLDLRPRELILLDIAELGLHQIERDLVGLGREVPIQLVVGSVLHSAQMYEIFDRHRPEIVFHAAAYKHVPLMEANPFSAVSTNALGTRAIVTLATSAGAEQCILLSTDKAVDPASMMGVTKRLAELILIAHGGETQMKALRLGNVLGSSGSVGPMFLSQIAQGGPVTITHPDATRFFLTVEEAVSHLASTSVVKTQAAILIPDMGAPHRIEDLARFLLAQAERREPAVEIVFTSLRPGEKLTERMISSTESLGRAVSHGLQAVQTRTVSQVDLAGCFDALDDAVRRRDLNELLRAIQRAVPEYRPSDLIADQLSALREAEWA